MTTSAKTLLKSVGSREDTQLTPAQLGYIKGDATAFAYECMMRVFLKLSTEEGLTKAFVARRLGKKPEQVTRWFGSPTNLTIGTYAEILAAMGYEPVFEAKDMKTEALSNERHALCGAKFSSSTSMPAMQFEPNAKQVKNELPGFAKISGNPSRSKIAPPESLFSQNAPQMVSHG